jgi:hypothetical protein
MGPSIGVTEAQVKYMITEAFNHHEETVGRVRHKENTDKFGTLFGWMNKIDGGMTMAKVLAGIIVLLCSTILSLLLYLATHKQQSLISNQSPTTVALQQHSSIY